VTGHRSSPTHLVVGKITAPRGLKGELKVRLLTDYPQRLLQRDTIFVGDPPEPYAIDSLHIHSNKAILRLAGIETREQAEAMRRRDLLVPLDEAVPLEEGEYYVFQIVGLDVYTDQGELLGRVSDVIFTGSNEVYVVQSTEKEILVPAIAEVVQEVDLEAGRLTIKPMEGLL